MGKPKLVDAAPAAVPRKHGPGGPWVTVRAHYGALPSVAGRDRRRVGESLPGWRACSRLRSEEPVPGTKALHLPSKRGDQLKAQLARGARTRGLGCLKCESNV